MNRVPFLNGILILISPLFLSADDFDNQVWLTTNISKSLSSFAVSASYECRYGQDVSEIVLDRQTITLFKKLSPHWAVDGSFKILNLYKSGNKIAWNVPYASIYYYWNWGDLKFDNYSRLEYHLNADYDNFFRFRGKLRCKSSKPLFQGFTPYLADEIFYDFNDVRFKWNRNYFGVTTKLSAVFGLDIFYCLQSIQAEPKWVFYNAGGISLSAGF